MTTHTAIVIGLVLYGCLMAAVSVFFMLRVKKAADYLVAGRGLPYWVFSGTIGGDVHPRPGGTVERPGHSGERGRHPRPRGGESCHAANQLRFDDIVEKMRQERQAIEGDAESPAPVEPARASTGLPTH